MSLPDRPLAHPSANMQSTADEKAPLLMSEKQQYARLIGAKNRQPHIRSSRRSSVCLAFLLSLLSLAAIATVFLSAANLSYSPDRSLTENVVDWSSTIASSVKQQISSWIPSHCPSLKESKDMIAKKQQEIMEKSKTMPYAGPIIDSISQFTEIDRMPLELAVIYYKALRSGEEGRMDAFRTFDKITKPSDSSQASSEQQREWQELANERGKALKRIFQILSEENDSNAPVSVDRLVQLLGKPDTVAATVNQDKKLMPGMSPGPYISSEFKPAPEDTDAVMDFIYYGESMQQGMSVKVNEASSVVTGDNISAESGGRDKKKAHSQVLSMSWFNHEE